MLTGGWTWLPGAYATITVVPWLVLPRPVPWWARGLVAVAVGAMGLAVLRLATLDYRDVVNPMAIDHAGWQELVRDVGLWPERLCVAIAFGGVVWLAHAWRTAEGEDARGLGWLVLGQLFLSVALVPVVFVEMSMASVEATGVLVILAQAFLPVALLVVVLRQRLWGIDVTVSRVTVWWLLTVALLVAYAVLAWLFARLLPQARGSPVCCRSERWWSWGNPPGSGSSSRSTVSSTAGAPVPQACSARWAATSARPRDGTAWTAWSRLSVTGSDSVASRSGQPTASCGPAPVPSRPPS